MSKRHKFHLHFCCLELNLVSYGNQLMILFCSFPLFLPSAKILGMNMDARLVPRPEMVHGSIPISYVRAWDTLQLYDKLFHLPLHRICKIISTLIYFSLLIVESVVA